jgi:hypothetical protein
MADGLSVYLADKMLGWLGGVAPGTAPSVWVKLHTADPGTAGTTAASSVTTRMALTWGTASAGALAAAATFPSWTSWAGTNGEVVTDISLWDASTSGNFLDSIQLGSSVTMDTGDTLSLTSLTITFTTAS